MKKGADVLGHALFMIKANPTPKNNQNQAGSKHTQNTGHSPAPLHHAHAAKENTRARSRQFVASSLIFVYDLGITLNEY